MKTLLTLAKQHWIELIIVLELIVIVVAATFFMEVRRPEVVIVTCIVVAMYFVGIWLCKPKNGDNHEE